MAYQGSPAQANLTVSPQGWSYLGGQDPPCAPCAEATQGYQQGQGFEGEFC